MFRSTRSMIVASTALATLIWFTAPAAAQQRGHDSKQKGRTQTHSAQRPAPQAPPANVARGGSQTRGTVGSPGPYAVTRSYPQTAPYNSYGRSTYYVRRPVFVQPYYAFRPRFSVGFGIHIGYAVAYPFRYYDPYGFYNFRIGVAPAYGPAYPGYGPYASRVGGLSFEIEPWDAAVFIDGVYVGVAGDFSSGQMPLTLAAGRHRVNLRADGFSTASFDITVVAGQVIPYAGTLPYAR